MPINQAKVKSVLSGDTLILTAVNNPNQERTLSLAFVSAPRMRREGDEPFAFQSRDFLRRLTVGKVVQFKVLYSIPTGVKRDYGIVTLQTGESLPEAAISEGWVKLRDDAGRKDESEDSKALLEKLELQEAKAKHESKGTWASDGGKLDVAYEIPDAKAFVEQWQGKRVDAIVERVLTGDRMVLRLFVSPSKHIQTLVLVAGIRAPATKRTNPSDGKEQPAEPFGTESHQFVETRLLQRNVAVDVLGLSPQGTLVCSVKHPNGSIADFLLKAGLARCTDFHSTMLGTQMTVLRQAEKQARDQKLGVFQGVASTQSSTSSDVEATVSRVQTADTVLLRTKSEGEKKASLSSIRQPKPTDPKQAPFQADAKEFLRKRLIGKHVKVSVDGKKAASEGYEEREVVTITVNNKNIALLLVEAGYASVIRHRRDDDDRSPHYDELLAAEEAAQKDEKGMWSAKPPPAKAYQDYSESLQKAKIQSSVLQRQKKIPAVVDYVKSGSRFTVLIPRENAKLTFVLSGIRAPRSARNANEKSDPFGQEAHDYANRRCMQRDVEIDVEGTVKVGGFIGALYINRENFAKLLLEEGFASVHAYSAEQSGNANELFAAEQKAKDARKGMWHDYDPNAEEGSDGVEEPVTNGHAINGDSTPNQKKDYRDVLISHVEPTGRLKLQLIGSGTASLTTLMSSFAKFHSSPSNSAPLAGSPKAGDYVAAKFSEDGQWYRARIRRNDREAKKADVVFIDYGNSESLSWSSLRPLSQPQFSVQTLKPQALDAALSFLQFPNAQEYLTDAIDFIGGTMANKELVASVDATEKDGTLWITLFDPKSQAAEDESLNKEIVGEGLAMVAKKLRSWELGRGKVLQSLKAKEDEAKEYPLMEPIGVYVVTYNCARALVQPDVFARHLFDALRDSQPPEILIISLQEIAPIAYAFLGGSYLVPYLDRIHQAVNIAGASLSDASYINVITRNVGMTAITAFVLQSRSQDIKWIETAGVGVGVYGMGNKGAVGLRLGYATEDEDLELSVIAAHLAPMEDGLSRRNEDWKNICRGMVFEPAKEKAVRSSNAQQGAPVNEGDDNAPLLHGQPDKSSTHSSSLFAPRSHLILAGDLNYRTSRIKPSPTDFHLFPQPCEDRNNHRHFSNLLKEDQLLRELKAQRTCHGLQEASINFPPTYKYSDKQRALAEKDDGVMWDWAKHRWPSWCDRILYTDLPTWMNATDSSASLEVHGYTALPLMSTSDHRPVALSLAIPAKAIPIPDSHESADDARLSPPFDIDPQWRSKRSAARRRELVVGIVSYLGLTSEGRIFLIATVIGGLGGWWIIGSLLRVS